MFFCLSGEVQTGVCVVESSSVSCSLYCYVPLFMRRGTDRSMCGWIFNVICLYCYVLLFIKRGTDWSMCSWIFISQLFILLCYSVYQERYRPEYVWLNLHLSAVYIVMFCLSGEVQTGVCVVESSSFSCLYCYVLVTLRDVCYKARWFWTTVRYGYRTSHF